MQRKRASDDDRSQILDPSGTRDHASQGDVPVLTISKWVELIGTGRYQWWVSILMGMIAFADCAEIMVTTIIIRDLVCEWDLSSLEKALIPGMVLTGEAVGSFIAGKVADAHGRRTLLLVAYYILCIASVVSIFAGSYILYICSRTIAAMGIGASYPIATCYVSEFSVATRRSTGTTIYELVGGLGSVYTCVCALFVMDLECGWRILLSLMLLPAVITLIVLHFADESPRYYLVHGKEEQAMAVIRKMARCNGVEMPQGKIVPAQPYGNSYMAVFAPPFTRVAIILAIFNFSIMYVINGLYYFIADAMSYEYCSLSELFVSLYTNKHGCLVYTMYQYLFYLIINLLLFPGFILGGVSSEMIGRKITSIYTTWIILACCFLILFCVNYVITLSLILIAFIMLASMITTIWIYTPESYPTYMRATSSGVLNSINRVGAAAGAFTTEYMDSYSLIITMITYVAVMSAAAVAALFIKKETRGTLLQDDNEEQSPILYGSIEGSSEQNNPGGVLVADSSQPMEGE